MELINRGSIVSCTTCFNQTIEGGVMAFDPTTKMLILSILFLNHTPKYYHFSQQQQPLTFSPKDTGCWQWPMDSLWVYIITATFPCSIRPCHCRYIFLDLQFDSYLLSETHRMCSEEWPGQVEWCVCIKFRTLQRCANQGGSDHDTKCPAPPQLTPGKCQFQYKDQLYNPPWFPSHNNHYCIAVHFR